MRIVGAIGDAAHWETMKFLRPGVTENQVTAHIMKFLYDIPGMEDVEDVIVSSGPNTWPNWRNFSDRIIQPGDIVFMDLAALTWNGYKSCYYRTYCVGKEPSKEQQAKLEQISGVKRDIAFGSQIRSYVLHPYQLVKDHRTKEQVGDINRVLDGDLDVFIKAFLMQKATGNLGEAAADDDLG
jgi:hypothetical protein